ncbi:hypothetical protein MNNICLKF_01041 [Synechococcus sp. CBW1107]|nr:hypothetical protein MNNICLKF_01041 [Synechococcus sp. CBW1107]
MLVRIISQNESAAISGGSNSYKPHSYFKGGDDKKHGYWHDEKREYEKDDKHGHNDDHKSYGTYRWWC